MSLGKIYTFNLDNTSNTPASNYTTATTPITNSTTSLSPYNFNEFLDNLPTNLFSNGLTAQSIQWTPNWSGIAGKYNNVTDLENSQLYKAFTDYVLNNPNDPRVIKYLKLLESTTTGNGHASILFNPNGELNSNWLDEYKRLRNDGKYGYYHLGPEGNLGTLDEPSPEEISKTELPYTLFKYPTPTWFSNGFNLNPSEDDPISLPIKLPFWTDWIHHSALKMLGDVAAFNTYDNLAKLKTPLLEANNIYREVTGNYAAMARLDADRGDILNRTAQLANNTSDTNKASQYWKLGMDQANKYDILKNNIYNEAIDTTKERVNQAQIYNTEQYVDTRNVNAKALAALHNQLLTNKAKLNQTLADNASKWAYAMYADASSYVQGNGLNEQARLAALAELDYSKAVRDAWKNYSDWAKDVTNSNTWLEFLSAVGNSDFSKDSEFFKLFADTPVYPGAQFTLELIDYLKLLWASDFGAAYRNKYANEALIHLNAYTEAKYLADVKLKKALANRSYIVSNQLFPGAADYTQTEKDFNDKYIFKHKKGSKISRLIDWERARQRELTRMSKQSQHALSESNDLLARELDTLDEETILYLKELFR